MAKKNKTKQKQRGVGMARRGKVSLEKIVCMQRSHGAGTRDEPQERLRGRRERVAAAHHPLQATAQLASLTDIFPFWPSFSPTEEPGPRLSYFQGLQTIESFRFWDGDDYKYEIFSEYRSRVNQGHFGGKTC